ncbi:eukaryotic translation initiation factor 5B [Anoplophora glabripennis]|nr:eukaryotic translation initiation factor 5B [Anoplophora glabripennis]
MGKSRKIRKGKGDESESENELNTEQLIEKSNKKSKSLKTKPADVESEEQKDESKKPKGKKEKKPAATDESDNDVGVTNVKKSFSLLQVEDSGSENDKMLEDNSESESKSLKKDTKKKSNSEENRTKDQGGKKGKKNRRKRDESDEDIEKVLAELEMEYSGVKKEGVPISEITAPAAVQVDEEKGKKSKNKKLEKESLEKLPEVEEESKTENSGTVKTAAQKKKEKKDRDKQKKLTSKSQDDVKKQSSLDEVSTEEKNEKEKIEEDKVLPEGDKKSKKKKKGAKDEEDKEAKETKKGPGKKTIAAMQEALRKLKEEEERLKRQEEEQIKKEEEAEKARLEALRLEQERKERKKQKEKERKERLKAEGKLLTAKQKADRARAQALIDSLKAQGVELPDVGERKPRPGTRVKPSRQKKEQNEATTDNISTNKQEEQKPEDTVPVKVEITEQSQEKDEESGDDVKDAWDASSEDEDSEETKPASESKTDASGRQKTSLLKEEEEDESSSEEESEEEESDSESEDETDAKSLVEKARDKALQRIKARKEEAVKNRTTDNLRAAIVCVLGHVDTGKTKILDKLRRTNVQDGEAGGITQQIGATNVPIDAIKEQIKIVKEVNELELKIPGLLIIDTPGHESFSNLRNRGSSLCDIAILVVDIMHGLEPQTIESINLLKSKKTPFIVALNKIDRLYDWQTISRKDVRDILKSQAQNTQLEFEQRTKEVIVQFAEQGLNAALFHENPDIRSYVSLVPTSAITGEGMGNLLALIVEFCQTKLGPRLMYSDELQATVLEVKAISGLGTTIDVILVNGTLREGDTMLCAGTDGPIVTQIRSLLMPQPLRELRVKNAYVEYKEIKAAQGVKIAAKELEKAIAGLNLYIAQKPDEVEILKEEVARELRSALSNIKLAERGVYVQASTLGSLEALLEFLRTSKIPYCGIRIGPVVKKDVMKASIMLEHESQYATILAFDVKVERDAQELADSLGVKIFQADIIYHLFDKFMAYREELKQKKREEFKHIAVFPCKLKILPQFVFNSRDPIVCGVMVEAGIIKEGTPICVPSKEFVDLGVVTSIENNHKPVESARKGMEICIKIEPVPGESPKMFGRHFDETDFLVSKISRQSIDACKDYFRDDLLKTDWQLMVELKKLFQIL